MANTVEEAMKLKGDYAGNHYQRFQDAETADEPHRQRALENLRLYMPTGGFDVYRGEIQDEFINDGRYPKKYNFVSMYAEAHAGHLITANSVDPKFIDSAADGVDTTEACNALLDVYYTDKNVFNYDVSRNGSILNGCISRGVEEIKIIRPSYDPSPRIMFDNLAPTSVIFDPGAINTDDLGYESREAWKKHHYYPGDIVKMFPDSAEALGGYLAYQNNYSETTSYVDIPNDLYWQNKFLVVEWYHTITEEEAFAFDNKNMMELPNDPSITFGSEEDYFFKKAHMEKNGRELNPGDIVERKRHIDTLYLTTFVPSANLVLQSKKDERQILRPDGMARLPFYVFAFYQKNGKTSGVVDTIKDPQEDINLREAARTKYLTQTPHNKIIVHSSAYGDDMQKRNDIQRNLNDPAAPLFLDEDAPPGVPLVTNLNTGQMNPAFMQDETWKIQMMDRMTGLPAAMQGLEGKSGESGVLFNRKVIEGNSLARVRSEAVQANEKSKQEGWFQLALSTYGGKSKDEKLVNRNRSFVDREGRKTVLNEVSGYDKFNEPIIVKDISQIRRGYVIITQTKQNDFKRQQDREINIALSQAMGPDSPQNQVYKSILNADLVMGIEDLSPDRKKQIDLAGDLNVKIAIQRLELESLSLESQLKQAQSGVIPGQGPEQQNQLGGGAPPELSNAQPTQGQVVQ